LQRKSKHTFYVQQHKKKKNAVCDVEKYCRFRQATDNTMTCTACWIPKVTKTHTLYVMLFAFATATNIA
jgi:hypothetical protein